MADGEDYTGKIITRLERERVRTSPNSSSKLLGVVGVDFPIFEDFGKSSRLLGVVGVDFPIFEDFGSFYDERTLITIFDDIYRSLTIFVIFDDTSYHLISVKDKILSNYVRVITSRGEHVITHPDITGTTRQFEYQQVI